MSNVRNIVSSFRYEISAGTRKCDAKSSHTISKGEKHFAYEKIPGQRLNICMVCAPAIIEKAQEELRKIADELKK
ncbi:MULTISPECIES: hypothetical protein [Pseudomonas]|uniref:hypothetical protein n=1 Tax=Pseudomonas TaxID=286 RepID=UPI0006E56832|nr:MULTISPECIES: hypothetical protein [Pseudomonas]KPZ04045.1 hypothetical protein ALO85_200201 [Pseudomonas syringae pv. aptata]